jgi:hypothetical protein
LNSNINMLHVVIVGALLGYIIYTIIYLWIIWII